MTSREFLADLLMLAHAGYSLFVVWGLVLVFIGMVFGWNGAWFRRIRVVHLVATLFVVVRVWTAWACPFSAAEDRLRRDGLDHEPPTMCPLGNRFHEVFHRFAFRGKDPGRFARSTTWFGGAVLAVFVLTKRVSVNEFAKAACRGAADTDVTEPRSECERKCRKSISQ
jgi:hypothetical protein